METLKFFFLSLLLTLFFGCTILLFENPIPNKGEIVQVLPEFLNGQFLKKEEQIYYDIERINDKHCIIYSTNWIHKDSIYALVESIKNDSTYAEFKESTLIIKDKDTTQKIILRLDEDIYYTEKEPAYEINLEKGYFIDDFDKKLKKRAILKSYNNKYFLNIIDQEEKWFAVWFEMKNDSLTIWNSQIADTSFVENLDYYNGLTKINKIEDKTFVTNPSNEELFNLLEEPSLFNEETWIRADDSKKQSWIGKIIGITFLLLFVVFIALRKRNNNTDLNYKKFFLRTFIIALSISAFIGIVIFLVGDFGETEMKVLGTTLAIGGYSITGLCSSTIHNRNEFRSFSVIGMLISVFGFFFTITAIWEIIDFDRFWQILVIFTVLAVSVAHVSLLLQIRPKTNNIKYSLIATIIFISIVALMLIKSAINKFEDSEFFFRLLGVFVILDVLGTIAISILNKITDKKE